ncbi:MAG: tRNA preQ1(34) S-adenosylmethionine ribosyltransferase-isomerase QueA [Geitlerinemataceae cyanobacterium]|mgnify:CR=1 FL=1
MTLPIANPRPPIANAADRQLSAYDYALPPSAIAQNPVEPRDRSRLFWVKSDIEAEHRAFYELDELLQPGDLLVTNDTRVIPARLYGHKPSGAKVEILLLEQRGARQWSALVKPGKRLKPGATIEFFPASPTDGDTTPLAATVVSSDRDTGGRLLEFDFPEGASFFDLLDRYGEIPFPPYVTESQAQPDRYQTIYAQRDGSAAAPTAGLHFTEALFERLAAKGVARTAVTLHVGLGTFRPVETEDITTHDMHGEWIEVTAAAAEKIAATKARGGRVIAVGTTAVRTLESVAVLGEGEVQPYSGKTELYIYPGYEWQVVDGLITNFHLPKSSLMMLVSAAIGRERLLALYEEALAEGYRFFSFGDAMLIDPAALRSQAIAG